MLKSLKRLWAQLYSEGPDGIDTPTDVDASFELRYDDLLVGALDLHKGEWSFEYSSEFKAQDVVKPLVDFPDKSRVYRAGTLWPFFLARIPSIAQPVVQEVILREGIDPRSDVQLLKKFGERSISNPFVLVESHHAA